MITIGIQNNNYFVRDHGMLTVLTIKYLYNIYILYIRIYYYRVQNITACVSDVSNAYICIIASGRKCGVFHSYHTFLQ